MIELLVATAVFLMLAALLLSMTSEAGKMWQRAESQKARRQVARIIMETMTRDLEAAAFPLALNATNSLQFLVGPSTGTEDLYPNAAFWQTAVMGNGPAGGLAEVGYFVQWHGKKSALCRYFVASTNSDSLFSDNQGGWEDWLTPAKVATYAPGLRNSDTFAGLVAENVLGLWITLYDSNNVAYTNYNSRITTVRPVAAEVGIAVIDPHTAERLSDPGTIAYTPTIDTFVTNLPESIRDGVQTFKTRIQLQSPR